MKTAEPARKYIAAEKTAEIGRDKTAEIGKETIIVGDTETEVEAPIEGVKREKETAPGGVEKKGETAQKEVTPKKARGKKIKRDKRKVIAKDRKKTVARKKEAKMKEVARKAPILIDRGQSKKV